MPRRASVEDDGQVIKFGKVGSGCWNLCARSASCAKPTSTLDRASPDTKDMALFHGTRHPLIADRSVLTMATRASCSHIMVDVSEAL